jgi:hypothetical protein
MMPKNGSGKNLKNKMEIKFFNKILPLIICLLLAGCNSEVPQDDHLLAGFRDPGVEARRPGHIGTG